MARISIEEVEGISYLKTQSQGVNGERGTDVQLTKRAAARVEHKVHHWHAEILNWLPRFGVFLIGC